MLTDNQIIKELGIENLSSELQEELSVEYRLAIGNAIAGDLSQEKLDEFEQIIQGNQEVIDRWLSENRPDFQSDNLYSVFKSGEDTEGVPAAKAFATAAWIEKNSPDFADKVSVVRERFRADLEQYK